MKRLLLASSVLGLMATASNAHTIGIGWLDNGDGSVTLFAEHWHGDVTSAYSDNGGLGVYDSGGNFLYKTPWVGTYINDDLNGDGLAGSGLSSSPSLMLTGYEEDPANHLGFTYGTDDWFYSAPLVLGNGTWGFFTGTGCCVDTMSQILYAQVTGITSVGDGTGPGDVVDNPNIIPLPAAGWMLIAGLLGLGALRRRA